MSSKAHTYIISCNFIIDDSFRTLDAINYTKSIRLKSYKSMKETLMRQCPAKASPPVDLHEKG